MNKVYTIFSELLKLCPRYHFDKAVEQYQGDRYVKIFTTWQQFMAILYSQITQKDSLRDIVTGLSTHVSQWYHLGITGIHKSTLSDANAKRDYRIFEGLFYHLLARCKKLRAKHKLRFKNPLYTIDDFENILSDSNEVPYQQIDTNPVAGTSQKRLIEHIRSIFYKNDLLILLR